jgi:tetratricopeptide (TPR) repeat protein
MAASTPTPTAETFYATGVALWNGGCKREAVALLDSAIKKKPDYPEAICMGGFILREEGKREAALRFYRRAVELKPDFLVAWSNLGKLLFDLRRFSDALIAFGRVVELAPVDADGWNDRACALRELGRLDEALEAASHALRLRPSFAEAALNLGSALLKLDRMEEALAAYQQSKACKPDFAAAWCGEALALRALDRFDEALAAFEEAERLGSVEAISGKGCLHLTLGEFEKGWEGYEARWIAGRSIKEALGVRHPDWSGALIPGLRVLVMNDHGLGDTIQFFRYLPMMADSGVEVDFLCPPKLHRLLSRDRRIRLLHEVDPHTAYEAQIAISSLPRAFITRVDNVPAEIPYLAPEPELSSAWASRIGRDGFKIGIVWQGNPNPEADMARSFPLSAFTALAQVPDVRLISLQKGYGIEQISNLPAHVGVEILRDLDAGSDAFVDTAAAMAHLDLIITCDTSIAHLAGALGRPVWVALKRDAEWRWLRGREDSPWYPTMRLFRQTHRGEWRDIFEDMAQRLWKLVPARTPPRSIEAPIAVGELIDKITILEIKANRLADDLKRENVEKELEALHEVRERSALYFPGLAELTACLTKVNARLWDIEDEIRACEAASDFGPKFISLARAVYHTNDQRAALKLDINRLCHSIFIEEKSYTDYSQSRTA